MEKVEKILNNYMNFLNDFSYTMGFSSYQIKNVDDLDWSFIASFIPHRAIFLKALAQKMKISVQSIAEVGVWEGEASRIFNFIFPDAFLYLIDPWEGYEEYLSNGRPPSINSQDYEKAYETVKANFSNQSKCKIIRKKSFDAVSEVPDQLDLVFIDGNHSYEYVKKDIDLWLPKVRKGGILSGHDYDLNNFPDVTKAVKEAFKNEFSLGIDSTWYFVK